MAPASVLLRQVNLLEGPEQAAGTADVRIEGSRLVSISAPADAAAATAEAPVIQAEGLWLAPGLVDPHSVLRDPRLGRAETLSSLAEAARAGGYGTVALLPWGEIWRDRPEALALAWPEPMRLLLWGSFSLAGADRELAPHADLLAAGACGIAAGAAIPPLALLERGLQLGEMGRCPVLVAPRDGGLSREGFVRECVEALRSGWPVDPALSEVLPLQALLTLADALPEAPLRLMNLSTAGAVERLRAAAVAPPASVSWWHLLADCGRLDPGAEGWRLVPPLGGPRDREALIGALAEGLISAVAVQHEALDAEERLLPLDQRRAGIAGHGMVLPRLWQELVVARGWPVAQLWQALCWGPCRFLGLEASALTPGSRDWILFDPAAAAGFADQVDPSLAANRPDEHGPPATGRVLAAGFRAPDTWELPAIRRR